MTTRIFDLLSNIEASFPDDFVLAAKENGTWREYQTAEYRANADWVSFGLLAMGFKKGDKVATVSNNRPEWAFMDMGMLQIGCVHVPIYPTISDEDYKHILRHSEARIIIVSSSDLYARIKPIQETIDSMEGIYTFDKVEDALHWSEIIELGKQNEAKYRAQLSELRDSVSENDLASIIYTSGTTGVPKGVMLSHKNFMSNVAGTT